MSQVKTTKILYWTVTGLMAAFMLMASVPDVLEVPGAAAVFRHLGYPIYLLPFIGVAKILGVVTILVPGFRRLKEWAYAGVVFDLLGALYSHVSVGDSPSGWVFAVIGLLLVSGSYLIYQLKLTYEHDFVAYSRRVASERMSTGVVCKGIKCDDIGIA